MIVDETFINKLKEFGLNSYEVKLWVALLSRGVSTAGELSDIANVPRSRTYDVLESLEKKGFIIMKIGKPIKYLAVEPNHVVDNLKKLVQKEAEERAKNMDVLKNSDLLKELKYLHTNGIEHIDSTELSGSIKGRQNLYSQIENTIAQAEKSVTILTTADGFLRKIDGLKPTFEKLAKRGVVIRIATELNQKCEKVAKELEGIAQVRHISHIKGRFVLVDGEQLVFMVLDDATVHPTYDVGIWVNTPFFTQALEGLFELAWNEMKIIVAQKK